MTTQADWTRSSFCGSTTCIEIRRDHDDYLIRDSKDPDQPPLRFTETEWIDFLGRIRRGEYEIM